MRPFRQGSLDRLCGVYAVVNATQLALQDYRQMTSGNRQELFEHLIDQLNNDGLLLDAITQGINANTLRTLLRCTANWLLGKYELQLSVQRPFYHAKSFTSETFANALDMRLRHQHTAAILSLVYYCNHWTVIHNITAKSLVLYDSAGKNRLAQKKVNLRSTHGNAHQLLIPLREVFLIQVSTL
jgi:hypothetical protein